MVQRKELLKIFDKYYKEFVDLKIHLMLETN